MTEQLCDHCEETIEGEPIRRGDRTYCSEACVFEASRSKDCSGRTDSPISPATAKPADQ